MNRVFLCFSPSQRLRGEDSFGCSLIPLAAQSCSSARVAESSSLVPQRVHTRGMAYGPHAVGHVDGKVLFVRGAAPDEEIDVIIRETRPRYAFADLHAVIVPSEARRQPPCVYLPQ